MTTHSNDTTSPSDATPTKARIAKVIANAGLCSRREAEAWIYDGRVQVNGEFIDSPALNITDQDVVHVDGKALPKIGQVRIWRYHKPKGLITSTKDPQGRPTVFGNLPKHMPRVISIGRLDLNSEGLLLLTNNGDLAKYMMAPTSNITRTYKIRVHGEPTPSELQMLMDGVEIDEFKYAPCRIKMLKPQGTNTWFEVCLTEGKNREIRNMFEYIDCPVNRLIRVSYGSFELQDLKPWAVEECTEDEVKAVLKEIPEV